MAQTRSLINAGIEPDLFQFNRTWNEIASMRTYDSSAGLFLSMLFEAGKQQKRMKEGKHA